MRAEEELEEYSPAGGSEGGGGGGVGNMQDRTHSVRTTQVNVTVSQFHSDDPASWTSAAKRSASRLLEQRHDYSTCPSVMNGAWSFEQL